MNITLVYDLLISITQKSQINHYIIKGMLTLPLNHLSELQKSKQSKKGQTVNSLEVSFERGFERVWTVRSLEVSFERGCSNEIPVRSNELTLLTISRSNEISNENPYSLITTGQLVRSSFERVRSNDLGVASNERPVSAQNFPKIIFHHFHSSNHL